MGLHSEKELATLQQSSNAKVPCYDTQTIERDVARCTWHLLTGNQRAKRMQMELKRYKKVAKLIKKKQARLGHLISLTLRRSYGLTTDNPPRNSSQGDHVLRYYQGYHDIACIVLCTLGGSSRMGPWRQTQWATGSPGMDLSSAVLLQMSRLHLREYVREDFSSLQVILNLSFYPLLALWDRSVHDHLMAAGMSPFFVLPWMITWWAHDIRDTTVVKRIFDFLIASHPLMPLYLSLAMLLHPYNRELILNTEPGDMGSLHQCMSALPRNTSSFGFKYNPGTGYVSDDGSVSTEDTDGQTWGEVEEDEVLVWHEDLASKRPSSPVDASPSPILLDVGSLASFDSSLACKVPLQNLIDQAIAYMQALPPRQIIRLATRYHGKEGIRRFVGNGPLPSWLGSKLPATSWCIAPRAAQVGKSRLKSKSLASDLLQQDPGIVRRIVYECASNKAVIASGWGTSRRQQRSMRKRRNRMLVLGAFVTVVFITFAWYYQAHIPRMTSFELLASTNSSLLLAFLFSFLAMAVTGFMLLEK